MRERRSLFRTIIINEGITPAYAGKTIARNGLKRVVQDHPRVCGKDFMLGVIVMEAKGSPPRMRERRTQIYKAMTSQRITPAYAGKTLAFLCPALTYGDHPRVCGKDESEACHFELVPGSPPRMRERQWCKVSSSSDYGITPAYAGKTVV